MILIDVLIILIGLIIVSFTLFSKFLSYLGTKNSNDIILKFYNISYILSIALILLLTIKFLILL